jgi:hypothetical protein
MRISDGKEFGDRNGEVSLRTMVRGRRILLDLRDRLLGDSRECR